MEDLQRIENVCKNELKIKHSYAQTAMAVCPVCAYFIPWDRVSYDMRRFRSARAHSHCAASLWGGIALSALFAACSAPFLNERALPQWERMDERLI